MPKLHLPVEFHNATVKTNIVHGMIVRENKVVTSESSPINVPFSGPLGKSFEKDQLKGKRVLNLNPGETSEFTNEEAKFLLERYPFVQLVKETPKPKVYPALPPNMAVGPSLGEEPLPTNYMKLKAYAKMQGVDVEKTDKKVDLLRKIKELKSRQA